MYNSGAGVFNDGFSGSNQAFAQAQAILGLVAAGQPVPAVARTQLTSLQGTSGPGKGSWQSFGTYDTNTTSMAMMALEAAGVTTSTDPTIYADAFTFLHSQQ